MYRTGIPASIKLAQAIHESSCGKSDLACKANNHFGIKCGNDWTGKSYKKEDDDYEEGQLVKSCFREFKDVQDSYVAHSDFLTDPAKAKRYGFLFELDVTDYKGWARGLSKAGYATDPQYANKIIDIIERYQLYELDAPSNRALASAPKQSLGRDIVLINNDIKYVLAKAGDTPESIASKHDMSPRQLIKYNDDIEKEHQYLEPGSIVYLQPKRTQNHGKQKVHLLKHDEDLIAVSQKYGIKLESLLKRNGLQPGDIPAPNQKILLKGKSKSKLRVIDPYDIPEEKHEKISPEPGTELASSSSILANNSTLKAKEVLYQKSEIINTPSVIKSPDHIVVKGDTLYSIARKYSLSVDELRKLNTLSSDTISIGQKLMIK
jgi:LysM repeat protein